MSPFHLRPALALVLLAIAPGVRGQQVIPAPPPERAERAPAPAADGWHLSLGAGTDFPVAVGGRVELEAPFRLHLSTSLGFIPGLYVDAINSVVVERCRR